MPLRSTTPAELAALAKQGAVTLIDVRTPAEFAAAHAPGARNLPLDRLDALALAGTNGPVHVICQGGVRSRKAAEQLVAAGVPDVVDVLGGTNAWVAAGLPVEGSGKAVFSVDRQTRCVIGGTVVLGVALALTVHPYWALLSGFMGAGLFVAGLTNWCGLALLLAAMPWNRSPAAAAGVAANPAAGSCCGAPAKG
jgi:rhodanese-related sulfurtransferase